MKKIVVSAPSWFPSSGGLTILHKLCDVLNNLGYDAYLAPSGPSGLGHHHYQLPFYTPYKGVKFITEEVFNNLQDAIVIYAETWYGNYLNAPNVVRWIMGATDEKYMTAGAGWGITWDAWKDSELWFWYSPLYKTKKFTNFEKNLDNDLYLPEFRKDIFINRGEERDMNCWILRKAHGKVDPSKYIHDPSDIYLGDIDKSIPEHDFVGEYAKFADVLNRTNRFYSYDTYTFASVQAAMCGADSIVAPAEGLDKDTYFKGHELHRYIAYGIDDIPRARAIRGELKDHIEKIESDSINQIHKFVQKCNEYFK